MGEEWSGWWDEMGWWDGTLGRCVQGVGAARRRGGGGGNTTSNWENLC